METMYSEFGSDLKDARDWTEKGDIIIQFSTDDEPENYTDLFVSADSYDFDITNLTDEQISIVTDYAEKAQQSICECKVERYHDAQTRDYLSRTAHW